MSASIGIVNRRRDVLRTILTVATVAPLSGFATAATPRVAVLWFGTKESVKALEEGFLAGFADYGYEQGRNIQVDIRYGMSDRARIEALVDEIVATKPDVIAAPEQNAGLFYAKTKTIPIVHLSGVDPVKRGLVKSLSRPETNVTGIMNPIILPNQLDLLKEIVPGISRITLLNDSTAPGVSDREQVLRDRAREQNVAVEVAYLKGRDDLERAMSEVASQRPEGLIAPASGLVWQLRREIADAALHLRLPSVVPIIPYVSEAGGLAASSWDFTAQFRYVVKFIDRILKGEKPGEIPIETASKLLVAVNQKTARALGITIPEAVLKRASKVVD